MLKNRDAARLIAEKEKEIRMLSAKIESVEQEWIEEVERVGEEFHEEMDKLKNKFLLQSTWI